jgi:hypothetical protein
MPNGIYPIPPVHYTPASPSEPSLWLRLKTWWQRERLDEQLARGADPIVSPELELRSLQLVDRAGRTQLAQDIESAVQYSRYAPALGSIQMLRDAEIAKCADDLLALTHRLRDPQPVSVRGAAMASRLLHATSPLRQGSELPLRHAIREALVALDPIDDAHLAFHSAA